MKTFWAIQIRIQNSIFYNKLKKSICAFQLKRKKYKYDYFLKWILELMNKLGFKLKVFSKKI